MESVEDLKLLRLSDRTLENYPYLNNKPKSRCIRSIIRGKSLNDAPQMTQNRS
jgi:hypothetical protein